MKRSTSSKAKVLYLESCQDGTVGGSHHCLLHLVENLDRSLFEPIVFFYESHALLPEFQASAETHVRPHPIALWWRPRSRWRWVRSLVVLVRRAVNLVRFACTVVEYVSYLKQNRIALVHLNNSLTRHHEWICAAFLGGIPCVVSERGLSQKFTALDCILARRLALIIPMSCWIMDHMIQRGVASGNIRVMYDGLNPGTIKITRPASMILDTYGVRPHQPVVGIVGNIREWKGQETVVRALFEVAKVYPDVVCFFVGAATPGDKPYMDRLHALIKEAGIEANVRFTGYQPDPPSFINVMGVVIHASIQPEPFGMVVLEAMAQHKPVIGSRAGGVIEMVVDGQTGYTFPSGDSSLLASRVIDLLNRPDDAARMGYEGYKRLMTSFTLERYMEQIHAAYQAILEKKPLPMGLGISFIPSGNDSRKKEVPDA